LDTQIGSSGESTRTEVPTLRRYSTHIVLLLLTFGTATLAGVSWLNKNPDELSNFTSGLPYAFFVLAILSSHEFGHYFAARRHKLDVTLPFFIPFPFLSANPFGTLGAVIKLRSPIPTRKVLFDVGASGPIAGFIISLVILIYGFLNLPGKEYLYSIHPEYASMVSIPEGGIRFGSNILFYVMSHILPPAGSFIPPMNEVYHYPALCAGWFGLFVTALNLIPIGQLDGGRICFSLFGDKQHRIAQVALVLMVLFGLAGLLPAIGIEFEYGYFPWLVWAFIIAILIRVFKIHRQGVEDTTPLDPTRKAMAWFCIAIFITCFTPMPLTFNFTR
jgi:Zn-dependent protease